MAWLWAAGQACGVPAWGTAALTGPPAGAAPAPGVERPWSIMACSANTPSSPTTPVTAPARDPGTLGDPVFTTERG